MWLSLPEKNDWMFDTFFENMFPVPFVYNENS